MASCPACLASSLRRATRPSTRSVSTWFSYRPEPSPVASTSRLPGAPLGVVSAPLPTRRHGKGRAEPQTLHQPPLAPTTNQLKTRMIRSLQTRKPREALRLLMNTLDDPAQVPPPEQLLGLAHLFFAYNKPELAMEAVLKLHERGLRIPPAMAVKLLQSAYHELVVDQDKLATVVGWLKEGVMNERAKDEGEAMDVQLVLTVMSLLKRLGHAEWAMSIFEAWLDALPEGQVGPSMVWSQAISVLASVEDVVGAREVFMEWRRRWRSVHLPSSSATPSRPSSSVASTSAEPTPSRPRSTIPPEQPYTTLLSFLASRPSSTPQRKDPIIPILALIKHDHLPLSLGLFHTLLRVEMHRKRFPSFWGLWSKLAEGGWQRNHVSWSLAIKAIVHSSSIQRRRARKYGSPLQTILPEPYTDAHGPKARDLFCQFLQNHQQATNGRPALELAKDDGAVTSTNILNRFLSLFVDRGDWQAAAVVLETFSVHRVEPNEATHGDVVVGVVRHWEKGKLRGALEEEQGLLGADGDGPEAAGRMRRRAEMLGGRAGGQLISRILEQRQFRVKMFVEGGGVEESGVQLAQQRPPAWMLEKERREMAYLFSLLRRSEGMDELRWKEEMAKTRAEMLPGRWSERRKERRVSGEEEA